ncbi:MAG: ParB/RepB/Spo0J family partition protein [Sedimenticola sp.]
MIQTKSKVASLAALMNEAEQAGKSGLPEIALDSIRRDPLQPRKTFPPKSLQELCESIKAQGVVQPIVIRPDPDNGGYLLITGERRWRSSQMAGLTTIPAVIRDIDDNTALACQLVENLDRENVPVLEEAEAVSRLVTILGKGNKVAKALGRSPAWVSQKRKLHKAAAVLQPFVDSGASRDPEVLGMLVDLHKTAPDPYGQFLTNMQSVTRQSVRDALDIAKGKKVPDTDTAGEGEAGEGAEKVSHVKQKEPLNEDNEDKIESGDIDAPAGLSPSPAAEKKKPPMKKRIDPSILALEETLTHHTGAAVKIDYDADKGGVIHINFHSLEELDTIMDTFQ